MLHNNFQSHQHFCFGEKCILKFLPYMGMAANLVMWPGAFEQTFVPPSHGGSMWNLTDWPSGFLRRRLLKRVDETTYDDDDGRTTEPFCTISSPNEPKGSGELKKKMILQTRLEILEWLQHNDLGVRIFRKFTVSDDIADKTRRKQNYTGWIR